MSMEMMNPALLLAALFLATFALEDVATATAASLVAEMHLSPLPALLSVLVGIILGDLGLYLLGRAAHRMSWAQRIARNRRLVAFGAAGPQRVATVILIARLVPGLRLPTFVAAGLARVPALQFAVPAIIAASLWTGVLFVALWQFGVQAQALGSARWLVPLLLVTALLLLPRLRKVQA
ncbi:VTT domain-containing protein [Roseiterribacter gracilis]|uniref:VTT domain-containing protein n=1 Tax=Roseiterribacter gracilis TaxID=2812848 RepID=A0A8S8X8K2_9PROT|nr:hypothetical protein TMPK1_24650 [Rhodospirillales bacterium TMPK1]